MREAQKKFLQQCQKSYLCLKDRRKNRVICSGRKFGCDLGRNGCPCGFIPGNITGAISLFLNITGATAPVLNTPLQ